MAAIKMERLQTRSTSPKEFSTQQQIEYRESTIVSNVTMTRRNSKMTTSAMEKEGITALLLACQQGRTLDVQNILRRKKDAIREQTRSRKVALHYCAEGGSTSCLEIIFDAAPAMLNAQDEEGYTPLHYSVINGNKEAVKMLVSFQADVNCLDNEGHSLIHWATVCGELEILDILLTSGAPAATPDLHSAHPIHYAAQMCGAIQSDSRTARVQSTVYGVSPKKGLAILRRLLQHKVPVDVRDQDGRQPLLWAASAGSADAILALVNSGASVEAEDKDGLTALHCAASRGHVDCIENLIALCGSEVDVIDNNGCTALFYAVTLGHADCTELLLNFGAEPNRQDRKGRTPAHCGASKGQLETIKLFAKHGGNLWLRNVRGDLPLHEAVLSKRKDLVMWLLSQRPDTVNAPNNDGRCPIHLAALNNNVEMVKILIDYHAEMNSLMRTGKGNAMTPLDAAIHKGNSGVAKFLQLHGCLPASSLNDSSLQRRLNRSLESQTRNVSSLHGSQLGSHNEFSPDQLQLDHNLHANFTSPEALDKYANRVAETIVKQGPFIAASTPIMDDGGMQTDSSFYQRDIQVQVSEDFPNELDYPNTNVNMIVSNAKIENFSRNASSNNLRSSTSSSSKTSGKKLRKKKSLRDPENHASTESEPEKTSKRSQSKSSNQSRRSNKKNSNSSSTSPQDKEEKAGSVQMAFESQDQTTTISSTTESVTITQQQQDGNSQDSNESEKFSELENVAGGSSGESVREEDLGVTQETEGSRKVSLLNDQLKSLKTDLEEQIIEEEIITKSRSSVTYADQSRKSSGRKSVSRQELSKSRQESAKVKLNEDEKSIEPRSKSEASTTSKTAPVRLSVRRSAGSASSIRSTGSGRKNSGNSRPGSTHIQHGKEQGEGGNRSSRSESRMSKKKEPESKLKTPPASNKRFPSPISFISNPSQDDATDQEDVSITTDLLNNEPKLQEAAAARRRKSESKSVASKPTPGLRKTSIYSSSGKSLSSRKSSTNTDRQGRSKLSSNQTNVDPGSIKPTTSQVGKSRESSNDDEIRLQEELMALSKRGSSQASRIPRSQDTRVSKVQKPKGKITQISVPDDKSNVKGGDSGYSDQMMHTTSASEDHTRLHNNIQQLLKSNTNGAVVRRKVTTVNSRRPGSSSSARIIARQRLVVSPKKGSHSTRERQRYEATQKSILGDLDDGLNGSVEDLTTSHGGSGSLTSEEGYRRRQLSKRKTTSRSKFTFTNGDDVTSGRKSPKHKNLDVDTPISVTQAMQSSMRKYNLERKIFQELLELKRLQIRSGKANEQVLVKRLADGYKKEGLSVNFREYDGPFTYINFEKYLYDQLRLLQTNRKLLPRFAPSDDLEKLSLALKKMNATKLPYLLDDIERSESTCDQINCTHMTHRCHHAAHAYTGIPCAAYIGNGRKTGFLPQVDSYKAPGPIPKTSTSLSTSNHISSKPFTPSPGMKMVVSPRRGDTQSPITLEVQQGDKTQVFSLPSQSLDPTKNYYVSLSIKPTPSPPIPLQENLSNNTVTNYKKSDENPANNNLKNNDADKKNEIFNHKDRKIDDSLGALIINAPSTSAET